MKSSPLSLNLSYPTLINIISNPEGSGEAGYDVECDLEIGQSTSAERRWRVQLTVTFNAKGAAIAAHRGEVTYVGIFTIAEDYPAERMPRLIAVDAPSILYSSVRELVALLTGRGPSKIVLLPTVSFIQNAIVPPSQVKEASARAAIASRTPQKKGAGLTGQQRRTLQRAVKKLKG